MSQAPDTTHASAAGAFLIDIGLDNVGQVLLRAADGDGGLVWLDDDGAAHSRPYRTLLDEARRILGGLNAAGVGQGDRVILPVKGVGTLLPLLWACFLGGIVAVPMAPPPLVEEDAPALRKLHGVWSLLARPVVVADGDLPAALAAHAAAQGWTGFRALPAEPLWNGGAVTRLPPVSSGDPAMMPLTSGSTGMPKAVRLTHANILAMVAGTIQANGFTTADVTLNWMPLDHPGANVFLGVMPALLGGWQVHAPTSHILTDPLRWLELIDRHRASVSWAPNFAFSLIGRSADRLAGMRLDLSCMRFLVSAGEQVAAATSAAALELLERYGLPDNALRPAFGMAESCSGITWSRGLTRAELAGNPASVSLGPPIPGAAIRVTDDDGAVLPEGEIGHLEMRGPSVTAGYTDNPEANAEALKPGGWFATGDLAYIAGGELHITGRKKQIIIINGLNIPAHDVEAAAEEIEGVAPSFTAAFSVWNATHGTEELVLLFSPSNPAPDGLAELGRRIRLHLTRRTGLAPAHLVPLPADQVPKTSIGKIQRLELKRRFERGEFRDRALPASAPLSAPADVKHPAPPSRRSGGGQDAVIADIWRTALDLPEIGPDENFFEIGGHSILLIQVHGRLKEHFPGLELVDLFKHPTVRTLADFLREPDAAATPAEAPRRRTDGETEVAVIGMACRFPGADSVAEFWDNLREGRESIARFTVEELVAAGFDRDAVSAPDYVRASPVLKDAAGFDAAFFGYGAREAELMDPQQRLFLHCAWEALEDSGYNPFHTTGRIGVFAGASMNTYFTNNVHPNRDKLDPRDRIDVFTLDSMGGFQAMVGNDKDYIATRTSYKLDLRGPSLNVQTACSTGLVVIHAAVQSLLSGDCAMALAGAAAVQSPQAAGHLWQDGMLVSADGHCRAFDADASGTIFGSGVGAVLLKPLKAALADGDHVYAVIKGTAVNNDGGVKVGFMAPSGAGETRVVRDALAAAAVPPETITFLEAHGTGTALGDPIEVSSLAAALHSPGAPRNACALGSVKTNVGHLQIASGIVGFIKTVLALHHREIPPTLHFNRPNPAIDLENGPFRINTALLPWVPPAGVPRRAGVNSLGIGGTNAHVILEEAPPVERAPVPDDRPLHLLTLSARTPAALAALARSYRRTLAERPDLDPADLCFTANSGRKPFEHRRAFVFDSLEGLRAALDAVADGQTAMAPASASVKAVFRFGDDARPGLGEELFRTSPPFRAALERCDAILRGIMPHALVECLYGDAGWPDDPAFTRAAAASLGAAIAELWRSWGVETDGADGGSVAGPMAAWVLGNQSLDTALEAVVRNEIADAPLPVPGDAVVLEMTAEGWRPLLEALGRFHARGGTVDWFGFDRPYRRRRLPLPTYPFETRRFWLDPPKAAPAVAEETRPHPLLDRRFESPLIADVFYEGRLDTARMPLLADHRVHGEVVVSGACFMSMLLGVGGDAAARPRTGAGLTIRDVTFVQALVVPADGVRVQLAIRPEAGGKAAEHAGFTLISLGEDRSHRSHVTGTLATVPAGGPTAAPRLADCAAACPEPLDLDRHHRRLEERHIALGPQYRWMTALARGAGQAFCRLRRPAGLDAATDAAYGLHPGLIDSCFGLMVAAVDLEVEDTFIPSGIETLRFHRRPRGDSLWAWGTFARQADGGGVTGHIHLCEEDGTPVLEIAGLVGRLARRAQIIPDTPVPLYRVAWDAAPLPGAGTAPAPGAWVILADRGGLGDAVARRLDARSVPCLRVRADGFDPADPAAHRALLAEAGALSAGKGVGVLHLWSLDITAGTDPQTARDLGPASALRIAQILAEAPAAGPGGLWLVTRGAQPVDGGPVQPLQAPLWGLAKVLRLEHPALPCRTIDLAPAGEAPDADALDADAGRLLDELSVAGQPETAWRGGLRHAPALRAVPLPAPRSVPLTADACYLVTGGSGALGGVLLDWLADAGARHIVVASRSGGIDAERADRLGRRGVVLHPLAADVADTAGFETAWQGLEPALPALRGIIHAAGVLDDSALAGLTPARLDAVARPKMEGALTVARLAAQPDKARNLDLLVLFSSAASVLGQPGQANYAAANTFLDALAADLRARGRTALSVGWGPWGGGGMAAADRVATGFARLGIQPLSAEQGRRALDAALASGLPHVCAIACDWDRYVQQSGGGSGRADLFRSLVTPVTAPPPAAPAGLAAALAQAGPEERRRLLFAFVLDTVTDALSFTGADVVDPTLPLMEQGLDSLASVSVRAAINEALDRSFPVSLVFEHPTVEDLAAYLDRETAPPAGSGAEAGAGTDEIDLDSLDLDELESLVNRALDAC
ncbi:acyl transferase domain-containing protein/acyl-CoA synthetase (AMP-forming)/AMP-acid ligase II/acyl carrier protein/aryl carrier-like protein [Azospirillum agricola]|uniref:type I polyketide synthase n=1 Tax=Azospirillum agricola TaxID=1720247 RepID=UPI001AE2B1FA|nr:type I polyketide synthase [Azospirillum agricola]MBP2229003.1 acyl transferase domain-containing protein/acyl-CoA synthetase (AMP-forming)/AMP-acid ligase II/acyl carrier protein/aryl carrier-like protein [Azospirillum agricola]